jgi:glycogen synthase
MQRNQAAHDLGRATNRMHAIQNTIDLKSIDPNTEEQLRNEYEARLRDRMVAEVQLKTLTQDEEKLESELANIEKYLP